MLAWRSVSSRLKIAVETPELLAVYVAGIVGAGFVVFSTDSVIASSLLCITIFLLLPVLLFHKSRYRSVGIVQAILGFTTVGVSSTSLIGGIAFVLLDIADRSKAPRFAELARAIGIKPDPNDDSTQLWGKLFSHAVALVALATALVLVWLKISRRLPWAENKRRHARWLALLSWSCLAFSFPAAVVGAQYSDGTFLSFLTSAFFESAAAIIVLVWSLGPLLFGNRRDAENPRRLRRLRVLDGKSLLEEIRTYATTILVVAIFGVATAVSFTNKLDSVMSLRNAFAHDVVATLVNQLETPPLQPGRSSATEIADDEANLLQKALPHTYSPLPPWAQSIGVSDIAATHRGFLDSTPTGVSFTVTVNEADNRSWTGRTILPAFPNQPIKPTATATFSAASSAGFEIRPDYQKPDYLETFRTTEGALIRQQVALPGVPLQIPVAPVTAICLLTICACLAFITDRVALILAQEQWTWPTTWLLIDSTTFAAKCAARVWLSALFLAPWVLMSFLIGDLALEIRAAGSETSLAVDALMMAGLVLVLVLVPAASMNAHSAVCRLKQAFDSASRAEAITPPADLPTIAHEAAD